MSIEKYRPEFDQECKLTHESKPYTQILNFVLQNFTHEHLALAVWCHFQSLPSGWKINAQYIAKKFCIGRDRSYEVLRILENNKLLIYQRLNNSDGTFSGMNTTLLNGTKFMSFLLQNTNKINNIYPFPEIPDTDYPDTVNQEHINKRGFKNKKKKQKVNILCTRATKKPTLCPLDFKPNDHHYQLGNKLGVSVDEEAESLIDWSHSKGEKRIDWYRTFNNWIRNEPKFNKRGNYAKKSGSECLHKAVEPTIKKYQTEYSSSDGGFSQFSVPEIGSDIRSKLE
jgi:uncharacterized protein YbdZ (MbtH family)